MLFRDTLSTFEEMPLRPLLENEIYNLIQKQIPEGYGELSTEEMAELIAFLASDRASWITGINVIVDGGFTKRVAF